MTTRARSAGERSSTGLAGWTISFSKVLELWKNSADCSGIKKQAKTILFLHIVLHTCLNTVAFMLAAPNATIDVIQLLPVLDNKLIDLLKSLTPDEWKKQTIAKLWTIKDVVAHLLDGNIRVLSMLRDDHFGEAPASFAYNDLVHFLNGLNADWVKAMKRVSPQMLILLLELTGKPFNDYLKSLNPFDKSVLAVDWVGETESRNWMEIARQYTEKWLHQQQIRDAVNKPGIMTTELFYPFINVVMLALPHTYRAIAADDGTGVKITLPTEIGGSWYLLRDEGRWALKKELEGTASAEIIIPPDIAWKLFSKSLRPNEVEDQIIIRGDKRLAEPALSMVSVMA